MGINVEEIMAEIRQDIKDKGYKVESLSFRDVNEIPEFNMEELRRAVSSLDASKKVTWGADNIGGGTKGFVKKLICRLNRFIVAPLADGQSVYNQQASTAFFQLIGYIEEQNEKIEALENKLEKLQQQIEKMEK